MAKVFRTIGLLEKYGYELRLPYSRSLGQGLFELRIRGQQEVRIFYAYRKNAAVLIDGFIKKQRKISSRKINKALGKIKDLT